jgi:FKBP-type peptidyl-prolyl cis-trans isomerase
MLLPGNVLAQQTPASATPSAAPATSSKAQTPAAKRPATAAKSAAQLTLKTQKEKFSYALGMKMGGNLKKQGVPVDPSIMARGMRDAMAGKTLLTDDQAQAALTQMQNDMRQKLQEKQQVEGAANKKDGEAFLAANKAKEGVVTLPSGLQYKILKEGTGPKPTAADSVSCNYRGTLINGTEFDSTAKHGGQPATFPVGGVIKGWTEALQLMPVGSKWQLFIPSALAYGERGAGPDIGPDSTLIFEVELVSIQEKPKEEKPKDKAPDAEKKPDTPQK